MRNLIFKIILGIFLFLITYSILIIIDIILPRLSKLNDDYKLSRQIIEKRKISDNIYIEKENLKSKYKSMIYPSSYNYYPLNKIVKENDYINFSAPRDTFFILCSEGYGVKTFKSDRFGFRNPDKIWDEKIDTVIIGDSFAEGQCVDYEKSIAGFLNKNKIKTLSLASGGNSSIHYASLAKIYLDVIKPKNVVLLFFENDNSLIDSTELHYTFYNKIIKNDYISFYNDKLIPSKKVENFNNHLKILLEKTDTSNLIFKFKLNLSKLKKYFLLTNTREFLSLLFFKDHLFESTKFAIDEVVNYCEKNQCKTHVALLRSSSYWDPRFFYENFKNSLTNYLNNSYYNLILFDDILDHNDKSNFAPEGPHYSLKGYEIISKRILEKVRNTSE